MRARTTSVKHLCFQTLLTAGLGLLISTPGKTAVAVLDLTTGGAAGIALNAGLPYTFSGVTLTATAIGGVVNATAASLGINVVSNGSDVSDQIDAAFGEELTFTITFGPSVNSLFFTQLDLVGVGPSLPDDAFIHINANPPVVLETGAANFNGTTDLWSPSPIALASGDTIRFVAGDTFGLQSISFDVIPAPEPVSFLVWTVGVVGCMCWRARLYLLR